jgi:hypothetical protein
VTSQSLAGYTQAVTTLMALSFILSLLLDLLFHYTPGTLIIVEFMQITSYLGFLSMPLPLSLQTLFDSFYSAHPSSAIRVGQLTDGYYKVPNMVSNLKFARQGRTGVFFVDILGVLLCCSLVFLVLAIFRVLLKCAADRSWGSEILFRWLWKKIFPKTIVVLVNVTLLDTALTCFLSLYNYSQDMFSAVCGGITLAVIVFTTLLADSIEEWFAEPEIKYSEERI